MITRSIKESILFRTSSAGDVQSGYGVVTVAGLKTSTPKNVISSITQTKYRAEVAQVVTCAGTSYTPTPNTKYTVWVYDPLRTSLAF